MSFESKYFRVCFGFVLLRAAFSTNEKQNRNQSCLARTLFPALGAGYIYSLRILVGPLYFFKFFVIGQSNYFGFGFTTLN